MFFLCMLIQQWAITRTLFHGSQFSLPPNYNNTHKITKKRNHGERENENTFYWKKKHTPKNKSKLQIIESERSKKEEVLFLIWKRVNFKPIFNFNIKQWKMLKKLFSFKLYILNIFSANFKFQRLVSVAKWGSDWNWICDAKQWLMCDENRKGVKYLLKACQSLIVFSDSCSTHAWFKSETKVD